MHITIESPMNEPIHQYMLEIQRNIILTKRLTLELYKVAGREAAEVEAFATEHLRENYGMLFFNFVNFPMDKAYPFLWKLQSSHLDDELQYIDKDRMAEHLRTLVQKYLSGRMIDAVEVLLFNAINSNQVGRAALPIKMLQGAAQVHEVDDVPSTPAPVRSNSFELPNGTVVTISSPSEPITEGAADGYAILRYLISASVTGVDVPSYFTLHSTTDSAPDVSGDDFRLAFEKFLKTNSMPGVSLRDIFLRDLDNPDFYRFHSSPKQEAPSEEKAPAEDIEVETTLTRDDIENYIACFLDATTELAYEDFCSDSTMPFDQPVRVLFEDGMMIYDGIAMVTHGGFVVVYYNDKKVILSHTANIPEEVVAAFVTRIGECLR